LTTNQSNKLKESELCCSVLNCYQWSLVRDQIRDICSELHLGELYNYWNFERNGCWSVEYILAHRIEV